MKGKHGLEAERRRALAAEVKAEECAAEVKRLREALDVAHERLEAEAQRLAAARVEALQDAYARDLRRLTEAHTAELQQQHDLRLEFGRLIARGYSTEPVFSPEALARLTALAGRFSTLADVLGQPIEANRNTRRAGVRAVRRTLV